MPPIPLHKNDPINASKPTGVTPQTANPPPTRTTPLQAPATTTSDASNPPAPQPGARPAPPTAAAAAAAAPSNTGPAAPRPAEGGYTATHVTTETRRAAGPPAQFAIPPPTDSQLAGRSTTTRTEHSGSGPTTLNLGPVASPFQEAHSGGVGGAVQTGTGGGGDGEERRSLEHPPGYVQAQERYTYSGGDGQGQGGAGTQQEGVGAAAWNLLSKAGEALQKGEEAAWRAVRNK